MLIPWKKSYDQTRQHIKKQRHYFANKGPSSLWLGYGFSSNHVWMWELDYKESWALNNWCFWMVVLEKTLESPLDCKELQPVHPKGDRSWVFIGRTDAEAETPVLWPPDVKGWLIWKDPDAGEDWRQEEKRMTEDEMVGCHHQLDGHEFEQALVVGNGQGRLLCCTPWGQKDSNWASELNRMIILYAMQQKRHRCKQQTFGLCERRNGEGNGSPLQYSCLEKSHGQRSLVGCKWWGPKESDRTERLHFQFSLSCIGEENGNPLQCSCLENLRDGGAWCVAIYGVAWSCTRLKWLSSGSSSSREKEGWGDLRE